MTGNATGVPGSPSVRDLSIRVALATTAIVAVAYLVIAIAVTAVVTANLTARIDADLARALSVLPEQRPEGGFGPPPPDRPFGPPVLIWTVHGDGTVTSVNASDASLPLLDRHVSGPETVTINGVNVRIQGAAKGADHVVAGETMDNVAQTQSTLLAAEIGIGTALLIVVFFGAVAIGRRVAEPVELARRRQLEFTADASHELRTPLSVIEAETTLALARDREASWYRSAFGRVDLESKRIRRLLDDLLWLARFDAARSAPESEPVDLGALAAQAADRFRSVAEARGLDLTVEVPAEPCAVVAPPDWLDHLLGVLLENACKYSPPGGHARVRVTRASSRVELTVDDSGPGIPPEERDRIFDRFHRATDDAGGAGLGLAIGDSIVRATNGRWRVGSSPLGGASMTVSWPAA